MSRVYAIYHCGDTVNENGKGYKHGCCGGASQLQKIPGPARTVRSAIVSFVVRAVYIAPRPGQTRVFHRRHNIYTHDEQRVRGVYFWRSSCDDVIIIGGKKLKKKKNTYIYAFVRPVCKILENLIICINQYAITGARINDNNKIVESTSARNINVNYLHFTAHNTTRNRTDGGEYNSVRSLGARHRYAR